MANPAGPGEIGTEPLVQQTAPLEAERRHLTVMFVDLVSSTKKSSTLDPEDMRGVLTSYQGADSNTVERFEGYVAKFMGDGVLCYLG